MDKLDWLIKQFARIALGLISWFGYQLVERFESLDKKVEFLSSQMIELNIQVKENTTFRIKRMNEIESDLKELIKEYQKK